MSFVGNALETCGQGREVQMFVCVRDACFISGTVVKRTGVTYYRVQVAAMMYKLWNWLSLERKIIFVFGKDDFLLWRCTAPLTHVTISLQRRSHPLGLNSHARLVGTTQPSSPQGVLQVS